MTCFYSSIDNNKRETEPQFEIFQSRVTAQLQNEPTGVALNSHLAFQADLIGSL